MVNPLWWLFYDSLSLALQRFDVAHGMSHVVSPAWPLYILKQDLLAVFH